MSDTNKKLNDPEEGVIGGGMGRRTLLKALAGVPVLGLFGAGLWDKRNYDSGKRTSLVKELGLDKLEFPGSDYGTVKHSGDLIRIGVIGFGTRGTQLSNGLGFMHPDDVKKKQLNS